MRRGRASKKPVSMVAPVEEKGKVPEVEALLQEIVCLKERKMQKQKKKKR
jgi:hypothetical protein